MKSYSALLLFLVSFLAFSCSDDYTNFGSGTQPAADQILLGTDTFHLTTQTDFVTSIFARPDSFLLGTFYSSKYGYTKADILAQVNCPVGFSFHKQENTVVDSIRLGVYYKSCFGDSYSPMSITVYEMNKNTFDFTKSYPSNLDLADYTDMSQVLGERVFTAKDVSGVKDSSSIAIKLSDELAQKFFKNDSCFRSEAAFRNFFKGIYVTTRYGTASVLSVGQLNLEVYYHYTYKEPGSNTNITVKLVQFFAANKEVRQVNRFVNTGSPVMEKRNDQFDYVASPANLQTKIWLPINKMQQKINSHDGFSTKRQILNKAILTVEAVDVADSALSVPVVKYLLLVKESSAKSFLEKKEVPSDTSTCAVLATIASKTNSTTNEKNYYYSFNLASVLAKELKDNPTKVAEPMLLIPVNLSTKTIGSTTIQVLNHQHRVSGVTIRSGKNQESPMRLNLVYTGF